MTFREMSKDDVLAALGLQARRTGWDYVLPAIGVLGAGVLIGLGVGMIFAPKSGYELRQDLGDRINRMRPGRQPQPGIEASPH